ncbi:MAG: hypothetical protein ACRDRO_04450 [Pseudonocardiaceae bacterium]
MPMPTALTAHRHIDPVVSTTPIPRVDVTLQLSARTVTWLADRPRARELVSSVWDKLADLEQAGHHPGAIAALRFGDSPPPDIPPNPDALAPIRLAPHVAH